jgi:energy-coupling factor transporter ATP-binding protein EcfA2
VRDWQNNEEMFSPPDARITFFAQTNYRDAKRRFGIRQADRRAHMYIVGKTGSGKSTLLETMIHQDLLGGQGLALLGPHGDLVEKVLARIPEERKADLIYFNVPDRTDPLGFNPLERVPGAQRALAASHLLEAFKKLWSEFWGPRTEHILRNALLALLDQPQATLADVLRLLDEPAYRKRVVEQVANTHVRRFWLKEYESYSVRLRSESIAPIQNKVGAFLANPLLQQILIQPKSAFDMRQVMDIRFRLFDDGLEFRYEFPEQNGLKNFVVSDEKTEFNLTGDHKAFWIPGDYDTNEYAYSTTKLSEVDATRGEKSREIAVRSFIAANAVQTPLMMKRADGLYINIHEAALVNYPAMDLTINKQTFALSSQLVSDAFGNKVYLQAPCHTSWRTIVVSDRAADILASKLILNLNEPSRIGDVSWIRPQKFVGIC